MDGMARVAEQATQKITQKPAPTNQDSIVTDKDVQSIPMEIFRFFNLNPATDSGNNHLKTVSEWALSDTKSLGGALKKIRSLEMKLGQPKIGETQISKLYNWIRMSSSIKETSKTMKDEIDQIRGKYKKELQSIKENYKGRLEKIAKEMERIKTEQRDSARKARNRNMSELQKIEAEYDRQLRELRSIRSAYKGGR